MARWQVESDPGCVTQKTIDHCVGDELDFVAFVFEDAHRFMGFHAQADGTIVDRKAGTGGAVSGVFGIITEGDLLAILAIFLGAPYDFQVPN